MLAIEQLSYSYDGSNTISFPDFTISAGETMLILGDSGQGKTTLLHLLGGIISPQQGKVTLKDIEMSNLRGQKLDSFRAANIGIIFQEAHFIRSLNVTDNLKLVQSLSGQKADSKRIAKLLEKVGLDHRAERMTQNLSQGEKQRLNILRAIITKPSVILADEPTSALDDNNCDKVLNLLLSLVEEVNAALVIVTHDNRLKDRFSNKIELT